MLSTAVRGGNHWHDEGKDDAQTNVGGCPTAMVAPTATAGAAAMTAIARCSTAGSIATTMGGSGDDDGDVEAPAVRVTDW